MLGLRQVVTWATQEMGEGGWVTTDLLGGVDVVVVVGGPVQLLDLMYSLDVVGRGSVDGGPEPFRARSRITTNLLGGVDVVVDMGGPVQLLDCLTEVKEVGLDVLGAQAVGVEVHTGTGRGGGRR